MKRFTVAFDRDDSGFWVARVKEAPAAITKGRTLSQARRRIREVLVLALGSSAAARSAALIEDVRMPAMALRALREVAASRTRLIQERERLSAAIDTAISTLLDGMQLSVRDAGELLGLSHQRVQQLGAASTRVLRNLGRKGSKRNAS
jgi:predicted RNase H-like HicB family nuclease